MADNTTEQKVIFTAEDKTKDAFKSLGDNVKKINSSTDLLSSGLTKLGAIGAGLFAANTLKDFFQDSLTKALEDETAIVRLTAAVDKLGIVAQQPMIDAFIDKMVNLGQESSTTADGLTKLIRISGDVNQAIYLSKLASDLAASGMGDYESNVSSLSNLLLGRSRQAAQSFGIDMRENATTLEILNEIEKKVTVSTEKMADTMAGKLKTAQTQWDEFKSKVGNASISILGWLSEPFNNVIDQITGAQKESAKTTEKMLDDAEKLGKQEVANAAKKQEDAQKQKDLNDKLKESFRDLSKNIVASFKEQEKAISNLNSEITDLDAKLNEDLEKSKEKYQADVTELARRAEDRIKDIDKQIVDEKQAMNKGWRSKITELEAEKAKEQAVIDRANGSVSNLSEELAKSEFDLLTESHDKEIKEIQDQAQKKKDELQKEIDARTRLMLENEVKILTPGFYESATGEANTFLGSIGATSNNQSIVFNFNDAVAGDDGIKKIISQTIEALNRDAALKGIGGK